MTKNKSTLFLITMFYFLSSFSCTKDAPQVYPEDVIPLGADKSKTEITLNPLDTFINTASFKAYRTIYYGTTTKDDVIVGRKVRLVHPTEYSGKIPLVISLHGFGGNIIYQNGFFNAAQFAYSRKFFLAMPMGIGRNWDTDIKRHRDQEYLQDLIAHIQKNHRIDSERIYIIGHSTGGVFALNFACKVGDIVAATMPIGAYANFQIKDCRKASQPTIAVHGENDSIVTPTLGVYTFKKMGRINNCEMNTIDVADDARVALQNYRVCDNASRTSLYTIKGANHTRPIETSLISDLLNELFKIKLVRHGLEKPAY